MLGLGFMPKAIPVGARSIVYSEFVLDEVAVDIEKINKYI